MATVPNKLNYPSPILSDLRNMGVPYGTTEAQRAWLSARGVNAQPPAGESWLPELPNGFDIYKYGFAKTPTIFFDPQASNSKETGSSKNPYVKVSDLLARCSGLMPDQTVGVKRGSVTRHSGFNMTVAGAQGAHFTLCPYGDAEALPIITSGLVITSWVLVDPANGIWSFNVGATEQDVWQSDVRLTKKTWSTNAAITLTGPGQATYNSNTLYIKSYAAENPNLGQVEISSADAAMQIIYPNIAATGWVRVAGLDIKKARNSALAISSNGAAFITNITSCAGIAVVGCRVSGAGVDNNLGLGSDGIVHYGPSDAVRSTDCYFAGNYATDCLNNALELAGTTNAIVEYNQSYGVGGNSIVEMWASNSGAQIRYNRGELSSSVGRVYNGFAKCGIWFANYYYNSAMDSWGILNDGIEGGAGSPAAANTKNIGNKAYFNIIINPAGSAFQASGGSGHLMAHNTAYIDHDAIYPITDLIHTNLPAGLYTDGNAATGFLTFSNNLIYYKVSQNQAGALNPSLALLAGGNALGATASVPSGNNNIYMHQTGYGTANWKAGSTYFDYPTYKTGVVSYSFDQNSKANSDLGMNGGLSVAQLGFDETTLRPLAANAAGLTSFTTLGTMYADGQPYVPGSATIGALRGT